MEWKGRRQSGNVEDRRGATGGKVVGGGIGVIVIALLVMVLGGDPMAVLSGAGQGSSVAAPAGPGIDDEGREFVSVVLADTEDVWKDLFKKMGRTYQEPILVLFGGEVESACGYANAAVGPFYCPADNKVYIDLAFYSDLKDRFGAPGDFAQAYVIAHEIGHHVQNQLGISRKVQQMKGRVSEEEYNQLSVRLELQADFYAGVWAHHAHQTKGVLEPGDLEEALQAAAAIGDDRLQKQAQGYVVPESFTHGTSEQRMRWFQKGWESGRVEDGDTFTARRL
ncbi:MAG: zinc metallopeptidase [Methanoregulaceae archaeon]|nr:zinc metallopeptidase [Methanoregulaceae archaeon]